MFTCEGHTPADLKPNASNFCLGAWRIKVMMMDELEGHILAAIDKYKAKIEEDEELKKELTGLVRKVNIDTTDNDGFSFILDNGQVQEFKRGKIDGEVEITIHATTADFKLLFTGELKPMKAWATKRLKFDASMEDVMRVKKLI